MNKEWILSELNDRKKHHDLDGVEITEEDVENVIELINGGMNKNSAIDQVLEDIYDCLSEGFEY